MPRSPGNTWRLNWPLSNELLENSAHRAAGRSKYAAKSDSGDGCASEPAPHLAQACTSGSPPHISSDNAIGVTGYRTPMVLSVKCAAPSGSTDPTRWTRNRSAPRYFSLGGVTAKSFAAERRSLSRSASATIAGSAACSGRERASNLEKRDRSLLVSHGSVRGEPSGLRHRFRAPRPRSGSAARRTPAAPSPMASPR
jgi:hypothetical protein